MAKHVKRENLRSIDRLYRFAEWCREFKLVRSLSEWEAECGLSGRYLSNTIESTKGSVGAEILEKVYRRFPAIDLTWVITGEGSMINSRMEVPKVQSKIEDLMNQRDKTEKEVFDLIVRREQFKKETAVFDKIVETADELRRLLKKIPK